MRRWLKTEATQPRSNKQDTANLTAFLADGHMQAREGGLWVVHCDDMIAPVLEQQQIPASSPCERPRLDLAGGGGDESSAAFCRKSRIPEASWCVWVCSVGGSLLFLLGFSAVHHGTMFSLSAAPAADEGRAAQPTPRPAAAGVEDGRRPAAIASLSQPATRDNPSTTRPDRVQTSVAEASPYR